MSITSFNPRPREGGDPTDEIILQVDAGFNPRPREGGDICTPSDVKTGKSFNPRPREGGDSAPHLTSKPEKVSIRAPVKGAIRIDEQVRNPPGSFNPRPREGGDICTPSDVKTGKSFNPRPREGGD